MRRELSNSNTQTIVILLTATIYTTLYSCILAIAMHSNGIMDNGRRKERKKSKNKKLNNKQKKIKKEKEETQNISKIY